MLEQVRQRFKEIVSSADYDHVRLLLDERPARATCSLWQVSDLRLLGYKTDSILDGGVQAFLVFDDHCGNFLDAVPSPLQTTEFRPHRSNDMGYSRIVRTLLPLISRGRVHLLETSHPGT